MLINELSNITVDHNEERKLLFVGNNCDGITGVKRHLIESGWSVKSCVSPDEAISTLESAEFGVLIIDLDMPESSGLDIARRVRWSTRNTLVILVSDRPWNHIFEHRHDVAPHLFFHKPVDPKILEKALLTVQAVQFRAAVEDLQKCTV
jgi:DNA-binding response OmpR family regulator